jgi:transcriptional regulator with XRE-family HTH domain
LIYGLSFEPWNQKRKKLEDDLKRIAARVRTWRAEAGLTLQKLGDRSGVSASTIHKIENLQTVPTISVLLKVACGLNRRPSELLDDVEAENQIAVSRQKDRKMLFTSEHTQVEHLVGMIPQCELDVWRVLLGAGRGAGRPGTDAWQFPGEVVILVEEGCIAFESGGESHLIEAGDSVHFDSSLPHRWVAAQGMPAKMVLLGRLPERFQSELMSRVVAAAKDVSAKNQGSDISDEVPARERAAS